MIEGNHIVISLIMFSTQSIIDLWLDGWKPEDSAVNK